MGDSINFTFSADNATSFCIGIDRNNSRLVTQGVSASFSYKCDLPGFYSAYFTASSPAGGIDSNRVYWVVYDDAYPSDFYANIIKGDTWIKIGVDPINVELAKEGNRSYDPKQVWHLVNQSDGSYKIINEYNGKLLDVENLGTADGTNVSVYYDNGGANQRWYLCSFDNATYIVPAYVDKALDVSYNGNTPGTNVWIWPYNGSTSQRLNLYDLKNDGIDYKKPEKPDKSTLSYTVSNSTGSQEQGVQFKWTESALKGNFDAREYVLTVNQDGKEYLKRTTTSTGISVSLPKGDYTAAVTAVNTKYADHQTVSDSISVSVGECTHSWDNGVVKTPAGCEADGETVYTCAICKETKTEKIPATGHSWDMEWTYDKYPTANEKGEKSHHCLNCDERRDITEVEYSDGGKGSVETEVEQMSDSLIDILYTIRKEVGQSIEKVELRVWLKGEERPSEPGFEYPSGIGDEESDCIQSAFGVGADGHLEMEIISDAEYIYEVTAVVEGVRYTDSGEFSIPSGYAAFSIESYESEDGSRIHAFVKLDRNPGLSAVSLSLDYDEDKIELLELKNGYIFDHISDMSAKTILLDSSENASRGGWLCMLDMRVKPGARDAELKVNIRSCVSIVEDGSSVKAQDMPFVTSDSMTISYLGDPLLTYMTEVLPVDNSLVLNYLKDEIEVKPVPASFELVLNADGIYVPSEDISGTYTVYAADLDADGERELVVLDLVKDEGYNEGETIQQLMVTVYDVDENGMDILTSYLPPDFNSSCLFENEGRDYYYVAVDNDKIVLLHNYKYGTNEFTYTVLSYKDGEIAIEADYDFAVRGYDMEDNCYIHNTLTDASGKNVTIGSDEAISAVGEVKKALAELSLQGKLFPLDENGDVIDNSVLSDDAVLCMFDRDFPKSFVVNDRTFTYTFCATPALEACAVYYDAPRINDEPEILYGDVDGNGILNADDGFYLMMNVLFSDAYPISENSGVNSADVDGNGILNADDGFYLMMYVLFPEQYPLH